MAMMDVQINSNQFSYAMRTFYFVPLLVFILLVVLFFPLINRLITHPSWFWIRVIIVTLAVYIALVVMYNHQQRPFHDV